MKIIFIGKGAVGKTSIVKRLTKKWGLQEKTLVLLKKRKTNETEGIDMIEWIPKKEFLLNFWDFAGKLFLY